MTPMRPNGPIAPVTPSRSWSGVERMERLYAWAERLLVNRRCVNSWSIWSVVVKLYIYIELVTPVPYWSVMERLERMLLNSATCSTPTPVANWSVK